MDFGTWVVEMTKAVAWPGVVAFVLFRYRQPIAEAFKAIGSLKRPGGIEMTFERQIRVAEQVAKEIEPPKKEVAELNAPATKALIDMARVSPTGAIIEAWKRVEDAGRAIAERSGIAMATDPLRPYFNLQSFLQQHELLPSAEIEMFRELRLIRNRAAHYTDTEITADSAKSYVLLADRLVDAMESIARA